MRRLTGERRTSLGFGGIRRRVIVLLVMTDGRADCLQRTLISLGEMVTGSITRRIIHDDSGDHDYKRWLTETFPGCEVVGTRRRQGFSGAMRSAWSHVARCDEPFVMWLEDDFEFTRPVDLDDLTVLLMDRPYLAQLAFRRQAWGAEIEHGGFIESAPHWYSEHTDGERWWLETTRNFTTNPSVYRRELCSTDWPEGQHSEGYYGFKLREQGLPWGVEGDDVRFGFWGSMAEGRDWVWHIGDQRVGTGY